MQSLTTPKFAIAFGKPEDLNIVGVEFDDKGNLKSPFKNKENGNGK